VTTEDVSQALVIELQRVIGEGWSMTRLDDSIIVVGPDSPNFVTEVWRIARFVAYDEYVCIERQKECPKEYRISSRSRGGLVFEVRIRAKQ
jgi:hypothetical protein